MGWGQNRVSSTMKHPAGTNPVESWGEGDLNRGGVIREAGMGEQPGYMPVK